MNRDALQARKELLQMRAALERIELAEQALAVKRAAAPLALLRAVWPGVAAGWRGREGGLGLAFALLRRYPVVSSVLSLIAAKRGLGFVGRVAKWGGLAAAGWSAYRAWRLVRREARSAGERAATGPARPTARPPGA